MALAFHPGRGFGERYAGGACLAWHGSWNRAPLPQEGFRVVFLPFRGGRPAGDNETFEGALYVGDDRSGKIWRIVRR